MTPQDLVEKNVTLVSLPEVCIQVQLLTESTNTTAADIAEVVGKDTALTIRLLKLVNSAFFGIPRQIDTVTRAVNLIGVRELRNLTLAASAAEVFAGVPSDLIDMAAFWQHSVYTGLIGRNLATHCNVLHSERLFTAGLLHDVGRLLMLMKVPHDVTNVEAMRASSDKDVCELENEVLGFSHAEVGEALLRHWNLPDNLCVSVLYHHTPVEAHDAHLESAILHIADQVTHRAQECKDPVDSPFYDPYGSLLDSDLHAQEIAEKAFQSSQVGALQLTGVDEKAIIAAIQNSSAAFNQVLELLYPMAWETPL